MPVEWSYAGAILRLGGHGPYQIAGEDAARQEATATAILESLHGQPGIVLADEVGMGKTYVALAVIASVLASTRGRRPVIVMMPPGLADKWQAEWQQFKAHCCASEGSLDWVHDAYAHRPTDLFRILSGRAPHLVWMTTNCFSRGLQDPWVKLGLVRLARSRTRMDPETRKRLFKWATSLVRLRSSGLTPELVERLLEAAPDRWRKLLIEAGVFGAEDAEPIPDHLLRHQDDLDWSWLTAVLRGESIPNRRGPVSARRLKEARNEFNDACQDVYWQWLQRADWRASLLVLDEAHHAKNDSTRLSSLFRSEDVTDLLEEGDEAKPLLWEKFDRMLFLTATPFQLGHHELIRVLRSFAGARWSGTKAPNRPRAEFVAALAELEVRLDENRLAGRRLDHLWGKLTPAHIGTPGPANAGLAAANAAWWRRARDSDDFLTREVIRAVEDCQRTRTRAERDEANPWLALRTWVIRHNRSPLLPRREGSPNVRRRETHYGDALGSQDGAAESGSGLPLAGDGALPFLLAARAQGELAAAGGRSRAFFAEGLCSSYEAFHHTRQARGEARDSTDEEPTTGVTDGGGSGIVPVAWYEEQIGRLIPSRAASDEERLQHPKVWAVVDRVVKLWEGGEKVLVFCFYRETVRALEELLTRAIERATVATAARKLGLDSVRDEEIARDWLARITRRLADRDSPFHRGLLDIIREPLAGEPALTSYAEILLGVLAAYARSPSFVAHYLPLEEPDVRAALEERETNPVVIQAGVVAMQRSLAERHDASAMSMVDKIREFLRFARELAERGQQGTGDDDETSHDFLGEYLDAVAVYVSPRGDDGGEEDGAEGTYRAGRVVRMVYGDTRPEVRRRLMLAFNSPLFPEVLISSAVLGEGVDLHRFCRHVIHHDLCWNPSTLEQRTGRLDRIRCKAEMTRRPIVVYEPFLAGSADEKMFRVVRDRERWFQIVMGQKLEFDEATSEQLAARVLLPKELARELIFDLRRWKPVSSQVDRSPHRLPEPPCLSIPARASDRQRRGNGQN
jgi:superfamily II DNA or RNA helicase